ncbi:hypothetical protein PHISP_07231 [Aspergillus sp. HF37]|nr:hypothetical protein PHISP_07231 [Aspergillus sp. HF37]
MTPTLTTLLPQRHWTDSLLLSGTFTMPSPVARASGVVMTVSALVAAGIAVYESPQFREWVNNSRRKVALALHNLGDGIQPPESTSPLREDISMTEDSSGAAQERRRVAREDILRRGALFEARRRKKQSSPPNSFDSLVDEDGNLRNRDLMEVSPDSAAKATGVDLFSSQPSQTEKQGDVSAPVDATDKDRLHVDIPSDSPPQPRSETLVDLTPTSEAPETAFDTPHDPSERGNAAGLSHGASQPDSGTNLGPGPSTGSTDGENIQTYYAHPEPPNEENRGDFGSPFADVLSTSPTSATAGSYSHLDELEDASSDGTLSDLGRSSGGVATPASWSEVGSVVSSDDGHHHGLQ